MVDDCYIVVDNDNDHQNENVLEGTIMILDKDDNNEMIGGTYHIYIYIHGLWDCLMALAYHQ